MMRLSQASIQSCQRTPRMHAHAFALALKTITGVGIKKMLPTPSIPLGNIPNA